MKTSHRISGTDRGRNLDACLGAALMACLALSSCEKPELAAPPPPVVEVMEITPSDVPLSGTLIGQLDSPQNVEIRARIEAFVDEMNFVEGTEVKKDDVLFKLDEKPFLEKLSAANGALGEAKAALNKYQKDVDRLTPLARNRAIPQQDLDNALASVDVGKAGVITAEARVQSAEIDLGYCVVKAPMNGLIGAKQVSIGDLVGKGEPTLLATMSTLDPIWFYCNVSEVSYLKFTMESERLGRKVDELPLTLILPGGEEHAGEGRIVFTDRAVNVKTGTLRLRASFPNKEKLLRPGMFARVRVNLGIQKDSIQVPERAVVQLQGKNFLWVVSSENVANQRPVEVGEQNGSNLLVLEGIKPGERIVLEGLQKVREGAPVNPMTSVQMAAMKSAAAGATPAKE